MKVSVLWRFGGSCVLALSLSLATATAGAQSSAGQVCLGALAESPTCTLATTFDKFVTCFDASGRVDHIPSLLQV